MTRPMLPRRSVDGGESPKLTEWISGAKLEASPTEDGLSGKTRSHSEKSDNTNFLSRFS